MLLDSFETLNRELGATILMVTHDAFTASYCKRILFIKDGKIFNELLRGADTRKAFFEKIIEVVTLLGGDNGDVYKLAFKNVKKSLSDYVIYFLTLSFGVCLFYVFNAVEAQQTMLLLSEQQHALLQTGTAMLGYLSVFISFVLAGPYSLCQ